MKHSPEIRLYAGMLIVVLALFGVSGCIHIEERPPGMPQAGEYAFLDHRVYYGGTLVSGNCPHSSINVTAYHVDEENKTLTGIVSFNTNESLVLIHGESTSLYGAYGNGGFGRLSGAYALPYTSGNITVNGFTSDGTMYLMYNNQTIALEPGTRWMDISTGIETTTACTINRTVTDTITYYGNFPQSSIKKVMIV
ncbi:MAG TPA: hypothetical protein PKM50_02980 [Methanoregula sp.]|nr:hypothetical protein [Methanoregula sp.]